MLVNNKFYFWPILINHHRLSNVPIPPLAPSECRRQESHFTIFDSKLLQPDSTLYNILGSSFLEGTWNKHCKGRGSEIEQRCPQLRMAWVSCEGDTPHDREFMGRVTYVPKRGMPGYFFPYFNQGLFVTPLCIGMEYQAGGDSCIPFDQ